MEKFEGDAQERLLRVAKLILPFTVAVHALRRADQSPSGVWPVELAA